MRATGRGPGRTDASPLGADVLSGRTGSAPAARELAAYRAAVADLQAEASALGGARLEAVLADRLTEPVFAAVLAGTPQGVAGARDALLLELARQRPGGRDPARDAVALIRTHLLNRIDLMWWGSAPPYLTDAHLLDTVELVDLEWLRRRGLLRFRYWRPPRTALGRGLRVIGGYALPGRVPRAAGPRFCRTRREVIALLNEIAVDLVRAAPADTPPLWVTHLASSMEHQHRLRQQGYPAVVPSAHCLGYAVDVEVSWFRRFGAYEKLTGLLLERQDRGEVNVIDGGSSWHVCPAPSVLGRLREAYERDLGEPA